MPPGTRSQIIAYLDGPSPIGGEPESLDIFPPGDGLARDPANAEAYLDRMLRLLRADGVRFPNNKVLKFTRLDPSTADYLHAEGEWDAGDGQTRRVAVSVGPEHGPVTAFQVEHALTRASRRGMDDLVFAGFSFDAAAQGIIQDDKFEIARQVVWRLQAGADGKPWARVRSRHQLFPQVYRLVEEFVATKVRWNGCHPSELGLTTYVMRLVGRLAERIEPDDGAGEPPLLPVLNRHKPIGSTADVDFKTVRLCWPTSRSHVNQVVLDTGTWEQAAAFRLEQSPAVAFYVRNDHLECAVPYEYLGVSHAYLPDFLVRLRSGVTLLLEIKGHEDDQDRAKHEAARRWISAVNHWGRLGRWGFHVCRDPQQLGHELEDFSSTLEAGLREREARHREGYVRMPVQPGEFDIAESERAWGSETGSAP